MVEDARELVRRSLAGERGAVRILVDRLAPVIHVRVARIARSAPGGRTRRGDELRQLVEDLAQDVFASLFAQDGRALRAWAPERGLSLEGYVGLLAEHQAASILRSGRRSAWREDATEDVALEHKVGTEPPVHGRIYAREMLQQLLDRARATLSPKGFQLFELLVVEQRPVAEVSARLGMTTDAVYVWRSRLSKTVARIAQELESGPEGVVAAENARTMPEETS